MNSYVEDLYVRLVGHDWESESLRVFHHTLNVPRVYISSINSNSISVQDFLNQRGKTSK